MKRTGTIVLAEDHAMLRQGLRVLLSNHSGFQVVGEAGDGIEAIRRVEALDPDLVLMDLSLPVLDGLAATREIKRRFPRTRVLVLTVHCDEEHVLAAFQAGADGYLLKDVSFQELAFAVQSVLAGYFFVSPAISAQVVRGYLAGKAAPRVALTRREQQVLGLIAAGYDTPEMAARLGVSPKTVARYRLRLREKLNLPDDAALASWAMARRGPMAG